MNLRGVRLGGGRLTSHLWSNQSPLRFHEEEVVSTNHPL